MKSSPFAIGGLALGLGYAWSLIRRAEVPLSPDLVAFVRREQLNRLKKFFSRNSQATTSRIVGMSHSE
jgi:hypothetical protein